MTDFTPVGVGAIGRFNELRPLPGSPQKWLTAPRDTRGSEKSRHWPRADPPVGLDLPDSVPCPGRYPGFLPLHQKDYRRDRPLRSGRAKATRLCLPRGSERVWIRLRRRSSPRFAVGLQVTSLFQHPGPLPQTRRRAPLVLLHLASRTPQNWDWKLAPRPETGSSAQRKRSSRRRGRAFCPRGGEQCKHLVTQKSSQNGGHTCTF